ncbi:MAG: glycoside hydrolase family 76 protein, partial [Bacteroidota bacterium]|nr:glycoside hydrolase family 76 protein [Bacteroidota bacterium]
TSVAGFNRVWRDAYDPVNGGMYWSFSHDVKNACINYPTVIAAMTLYNITKDTNYLAKAKKIYKWSRDNLFDSESGRVADHKNGNDPAAFGETYTYNQGTCIGAAVMLYKETKDTSYLNDAKLAAGFTQQSMSDIGGILPAEGDWNEQGVLKAIFAHYMMSLIVDCGQTQYLEWIRNNINTGWANRDKTRQLTYRNYTILCPSGVIQSYEASSVVAFMQVCPPE